MKIIEDDIAHRIKSSASYRELVAARASYACAIASLIIALSSGSIVLNLFNVQLLALEIGRTGMTWGLPIGLSATAFMIAATGAYISRASPAYAELMAELHQEGL